MTAKDFLHSILDSLLTHPDLLQIEEKHDELGTLFLVKVDPVDMGTIIGRGGKTIESLRTVIRVFGSKKEERINIRLVEEKPIQ